MTDQDAQDITKMMSSSSDVAIAGPKKSKFGWIVLGCVILGVGLGVVVYQQSIKAPTPSVKTTPRPSIKAPVLPSPEPSIEAPTTFVPVVPGTNVITPQANTLTFPKTGKLRVYSNLNNIQLYLAMTVAGQSKNITVVNRATSASTPMNFGDSTFTVTAGSTATFDAYLNNTSGPKMKAWILPFDAQHKECGEPGKSTNFESELAYVTSKLAGEVIYSYQCWEDDDEPGEYNDIYMIWTYVPGSTVTTSPSPSAVASVSPSPSASSSRSPSPSPSRSASPSPSPSRSASPSPSASVRASSSPSPALSPSPSSAARVSMPDTSDGTPVTGVFEITVGTVSVGIVFLILGILGLLVI